MEKLRIKTESDGKKLIKKYFGLVDLEVSNFTDYHACFDSNISADDCLPTNVSFNIFMKITGTAFDRKNSPEIENEDY